MNYELMPMDRSHLPQVAAIERESFSQSWSERLFADELFNDTVSLIVAEGEDGTVLGYAELQVILDEGCLEKIAVDKKFRRQHVAEELLGAFLRFGAANLAFLTLEVRESNGAAIGLYRKLGFREVGRRKRYYQDPIEDAVLMTVEFDRIGTK